MASPLSRRPARGGVPRRLGCLSGCEPSRTPDGHTSHASDGAASASDPAASAAASPSPPCTPAAPSCGLTALEAGRRRQRRRRWRRSDEPQRHRDGREPARIEPPWQISCGGRLPTASLARLDLAHGAEETQADAACIRSQESRDRGVRRSPGRTELPPSRPFPRRRSGWCESRALLRARWWPRTRPRDLPDQGTDPSTRKR